MRLMNRKEYEEWEQQWQGVDLPRLMEGVADGATQDNHAYCLPTSPCRWQGVMSRPVVPDISAMDGALGNLAEKWSAKEQKAFAAEQKLQRAQAYAHNVRAKNPAMQVRRIP